MDALKVVIVDDQKMVSSGFSLILSVEDDIDVVATATNGAQALDVAREVRPDVTLMDVQMPVMDGIAATREIVPAGLGRVIILTTFDADSYLFDALLGILAGSSMGVAYPKRQRDHTCAIHEDIYRAIADRDAVAAHDLMAQHITDHHHYLKKRFRAALEQPIRWDLAW